MSYEIVLVPNFKKELKKLSKKYFSIKSDFEQLLNQLEINPTQGNSLGNNCYKVRMKISSSGRGKSSGARVITLVRFIETKIYLLSIYEKSNKVTISDNEIQKILKEIK